MVARGGHGGGLRLVTVVVVSALLGWRCKKEASRTGWAKRPSGPASFWADRAKS
jgi:hypothetical protein